MTTFKVILVILLLISMVVILLGIGHLNNASFHHNDDGEIDDFRREVDEKDDVIGSANVFRNLLGAQYRDQRGSSKKG